MKLIEKMAAEMRTQLKEFRLNNFEGSGADMVEKMDAIAMKYGYKDNSEAAAAVMKYEHNQTVKKYGIA